MPLHSFLLAVTLVQSPPPSAHPDDLARWQRHARAVRITRDDWGIAHVHGTTDADAVFGMIYAQAEDDFARIERNYLVSTGRLAEAEGEGALWQDLRQRLFVNPDTLQALYRRSPAWLRSLMDAWADGLNFYLSTHPAVRPRVLTRFEPWMPLSFSEGSIGGDIESVNLDALRTFYAPGGEPTSAGGASGPSQESNGFAIAPGNTVNRRALLLINPHTTFFFRSELQMTSDQGLNAYGAATWGQFFIYQGFNTRLGWMHTSTGADAIDEYAETIVRKNGGMFYRYGQDLRPVRTERIVLRYRSGDGLQGREFTVYHTQHGPVVRSAGDKWIAVELMNRPVEALSQSFLRTRARNLAEYRKAMDLNANSIQQHGLCRRRRAYRLFPPSVHPSAERPVRLDPTGGRQRSRDRLARRARRGVQPAPGGPAERVDPEHQQLALLGGGPRQSPARSVSQVHGHGRRDPARAGGHPGADRPPGLDHRAAPRRRLRSLPDRVRAAGASAAASVRLAGHRPRPRPAWPSRSPRSAAGTIAGPRRACRPPSPSPGVTS